MFMCHIQQRKCLLATTFFFTSVRPPPLSPSLSFCLALQYMYRQMQIPEMHLACNTILFLFFFPLLFLFFFLLLMLFSFCVVCMCVISSQQKQQLLFSMFHYFITGPMYSQQHINKIPLPSPPLSLNVSIKQVDILLCPKLKHTH